MEALLVVRQVTDKTRLQLTQVLQTTAEALEQQGKPLWPQEGLKPEARLNDDLRSEMYPGFRGHEAVAGMILLKEDPVFWPDAQPDKAFFIHKLAVIPSAQGQGFAAQMLTVALEQAKAYGKRYLHLDCDAQRPELCCFYAARGFACMGRRSLETFGMAFYKREVQG